MIMFGQYGLSWAVNGDKLMKNAEGLTRIVVLIVVEVLSLVVAGQYFSVLATQLASSHSFTTQAPILFNDEFDGGNLDPSKWDVYRGVPIVSDGWLTLPAAEIQSKSSFSCGVLQGVIQSSDWKSQSEFTDSSFGFEIWEEADGKCHHGVIG